MARRPQAPDAPHILIVGGGYVGMYTALRLEKKLRRELRRGEVKITVVDPQSYMTYQPFLPEAAAGNLSPRHVVTPLRRVLPHCTVLGARVTEINHAERWAIVQPVAGPPERISYDYLVMAAGSVSRTLPIPGLAEHGIGFKTIGEAIHLRNHVLAQLDIAESTRDEEIRRKALTFVFVGGGFAGVEALAELEDMARTAVKYYRNVSVEDMRWVLVEASDRILPEVGPDMGKWTAEQLRGRGIDVKMKTFLQSAVDGVVELSDGSRFPAGTLVWTAGVKAAPVVRHSDLPLDERGRIKATEFLTIEGLVRAYAAGDNAAVPDLTNEGRPCAPNAQHAVRQAKVLADNIVRSLRGKTLKPYVHDSVGSVAGLGLYKGVAHVYGIKLKGFPAWFLHRTYHVSRVPTFNRKVRVLADWTLALIFKRETVSLGSIEQPRAEFELASRDEVKPRSHAA
ncbi:MULTISPECIES: NAD(P)/FAD-dependent oxidoreductase [Thermomonospora]|uniref:FAD-dependent pyridine nucleotide-disulphide oxidoreductase n=1 Tax=Thermomonospora curvata (strain ATCC 19995 / DSM 43183 / JCM 3096 / KCTC 9072 / NBRC 15933 / NCIMB 10081 / Henssen B9) TaxID=471852 RepID=D1ABZ1_THECD|nr:MULTISPECIES: NAD(P)/FAD-dependent oxidoreductase [Thermomonospora]ACY97257.1 FAD-dependent pyridine nucleotide-disulphide oxidoreductase [Thermomonospora curvata DSM 43183]PKK14628.1 MAG: NAD(P)/FAD-dependent oxidoreductase [Thermomonospora sp. CIF 1]